MKDYCEKKNRRAMQQAKCKKKRALDTLENTEIHHAFNRETKNKRHQKNFQRHPKKVMLLHRGYIS